MDILGYLWVFFKYPKISKNGNPLFFPVNYTQLRCIYEISRETLLIVGCILTDIIAGFSTDCHPTINQVPTEWWPIYRSTIKIYWRKYRLRLLTVNMISHFSHQFTSNNPWSVRGAVNRKDCLKRSQACQQVLFTLVCVQDQQKAFMRIPTAHEFCVISACTWARAHAKRKRFLSNQHGDPRFFCQVFC